MISLLEATAVEQFELIGHSVGGSVAITIAVMRPEMVSKLVVAEPNLNPRPGAFTGMVLEHSESDYVQHGHREILDAFRQQAVATIELWRKQYLATYEVASPVAIHRLSRSVSSPRSPTFRQKFLALKTPRSFIIGAKSLANPDDSDELVEAGIPRFIVADAGMGWHVDYPDGFANAIAEALR